MTGGGFEGFLQTKIYPVTNDNDADHMIRRALSTYRLCFEEITDGMEQIEEKLNEVLGKDWRVEYKKRNNESPRLDRNNRRK